MQQKKIRINIKIVSEAIYRIFLKNDKQQRPKTRNLLLPFIPSRGEAGEREGRNGGDGDRAVAGAKNLGADPGLGWAGSGEASPSLPLPLSCEPPRAPRPPVPVPPPSYLPRLSPPHLPFSLTSRCLLLLSLSFFFFFLSCFPVKKKKKKKLKKKKKTPKRLL